MCINIHKVSIDSKVRPNIDVGVIEIGKRLYLYLPEIWALAQLRRKWVLFGKPCV